MSADRLAPLADRLQAIVEPFGGPASVLSITIEDTDGRRIAAAGLDGRGAPGAEVRQRILGGDRIVGHVVGRGDPERPLLEAIVGAVAAAAGALVGALIAGAPRRRGRGHGSPPRRRAGPRAADISAASCRSWPPTIEGYELAEPLRGGASRSAATSSTLFRMPRRGRAGSGMCIADVDRQGHRGGPPRWRSHGRVLRCALDDVARRRPGALELVEPDPGRASAGRPLLHHRRCA